MFLRVLCYQSLLSEIHTISQRFLISESFLNSESFRELEVTVQTPARIFLSHGADNARNSLGHCEPDQINFEYSSVL